MKMRIDSFLASEFLFTVPDRFRYSAFWQKVGQGQEIVSKIILDHYAEKPNSSKGAEAFSKFLNSIINTNNGVLDFFTTNYDIGIELSCKKFPLSVPLITGLKYPTKFEGKWNSSLLDLNRKKRNGLYVHRLHGCVRWFKKNMKVNPNQQEEIIALDSVPTDQSIEPCVMFPGRKYHVTKTPYVDSFRRLRDSLNNTQFCLIIGSSFRDNNIMEYLLEANDQRSNPLPIGIIDINDVRPRFFERIREVRKDTYFHYSRKQWKVEFIIGDYLDQGIQERILNRINEPQTIREEKEESFLV